MSKLHPIVVRARAQRAALEADIAALETQLAAKKGEMALLDKLIIPITAPGPKPARAARASRKVPVREHVREVGASDPGPTLPIANAAD